MSSGSASVCRSKRCATTIWKHSPSRIASLAASTAFGCSPSGVRLTNRPTPGFSTVDTIGGVGRDSAVVIASSRPIAWWYAALAAALVGLRRQDRVRDQYGRALEVVQHHQVGGEHHAELGHAAGRRSDSSGSRSNRRTMS